MDSLKFILAFILGIILGATITSYIKDMLPTEGMAPLFVALLIFGGSIGFMFFIIETVGEMLIETNSKKVQDFKNPENIERDIINKDSINPNNHTMKITQRFPNFEAGLLNLIGDKSPRQASNDAKLLSYMVSLRNFNKGFDYYELKPTQSGGVHFRIVTMLGLKTIVSTDSDIYFEDLSSNQWFEVVFSTATSHFSKDEYVALKNGYVKKSPNGCVLIIGLILSLSVAIRIIVY